MTETEAKKMIKIISAANNTEGTLIALITFLQEENSWIHTSQIGREFLLSSLQQRQNELENARLAR